MFDKKTIAFAMAGMSATSGCALADSEPLLQEMRRLVVRGEQLETANRELEAAMSQGATLRNHQMSARQGDVERAVMAMGKAPRPFESLDGSSVGTSLVWVVQDSNAAGGSTGVTTRADIVVELPMDNIGDGEGRLFVHLRAGDGEGIDGAVGAYAPVNAMAFGHESRMDLMQAWYQLEMPVGGASGDLGRLEFTLGKMDPFGFFDGNNAADDESAQFLNLAFIHNPLLDAGGDIGVGDDGASLGMRLAYVSDGNNVTASLGVFGSGEDGGNFTNSFDGGLVIGQLEYAGKTFGGLAGTYRLYAWTNGNAVALDEVTRDRHAGWGVSLDQDVADNITLFGRLGFSLRGSVGFDKGYTLGAQFGGTLWGRENDRIGLAAGQLDSSSESGATGNERIVELYYAWQLNDQIAISPDIQWVSNPAGEGDAKDVTVYGLRVMASF